MSLFKGLFGGNQNQPNQQSMQQNGGQLKFEKREMAVNNLKLRKETLGFSLKKNNLAGFKARVVVVMDKSGSMRGLYNRGIVQEVTERIFPLALEFDDNGEMEFYLFANKSKELTPVTFNNFHEYVDAEVLGKRNIDWGSTEYAPVMKEIVHRYGVVEPSPMPTFVIFITDGDNDSSDKSVATNTIQEASRYNIFWKFVGIGNASFNYLRKLDDMGGRVVDNANFIEVNQIERIPDNQLYELILEEFNDWLQAARNHNIV